MTKEIAPPLDLKNQKTTQARKQFILAHITNAHGKCKDEFAYLGNLVWPEKESMQNTLTIKGDATEGFVPTTENVVPLQAHAESQLLARLRIPASYLHRCPQHLQAENVNYWLDRKEYHGKKALLRRVQKNEGVPAEVRAVFSTRYKKLDDVKLFPAIFEALEEFAETNEKGGIHIKSFFKDDHFTSLRVLYPALQVTSPNDPNRHYWAGVEIVNSETGLSAIWVRPIVRSGRVGHTGYDLLDSSNDGATCLRHMGDVNVADAVLAVEKARTAAQATITHLIKLETEQINEPAKTLTSFVKESEHIPNRVALTIQDAYKDLEYVTKLTAAEDLLEAIKDLPVFQKRLAEMQIGRYFHLFEATKERIKSLSDMLVDSQSLVKEA